MPSRFIKESSRRSKTLDALTDGAERLFWRLVTVADDFGRFEADHLMLLSSCFPRKVKELPLRVIIGWRDELVKVRAIVVYEVAGTEYGYFPAWTEHQGAPRAAKSKFPPPSDSSQTYANKCLQPLANVLVSVSDSDSDSDSDSVSESRSSNSREEEIARSAMNSSQASAPRKTLSDPEFINAIKTNPAYSHIDIDRELAKLDAWLLTAKGRGKQKTRARILSWLNRIDKPMMPAVNGGAVSGLCENRVKRDGQRFANICRKPVAGGNVQGRPLCAECLALEVPTTKMMEVPLT